MGINAVRHARVPSGSRDDESFTRRLHSSNVTVVDDAGPLSLRRRNQTSRFRYGCRSRGSDRHRTGLGVGLVFSSIRTIPFQSLIAHIVLAVVCVRRTRREMLWLRSGPTCGIHTNTGQGRYIIGLDTGAIWLRGSDKLQPHERIPDNAGARTSLFFPVPFYNKEKGT